MDLSGKYRCEVSTDAPTFYTKYEFGHLQVARKLLDHPFQYTSNETFQSYTKYSEQFKTFRHPRIIYLRKLTPGSDTYYSWI